MLLRVIILFFLLMTNLVYILGYDQYNKLNFVVFLILIILFISYNKDINDILNLSSYQKYFEKSQDEEKKKIDDEGEFAFTDSVVETIKGNNYKILNNIYTI